MKRHILLLYWWGQASKDSPWRWCGEGTGYQGGLWVLEQAGEPWGAGKGDRADISKVCYPQSERGLTGSVKVKTDLFQGSYWPRT